MPYIIGFSLALAVGALAHWVRFDRDRSFYPTVLALTVSYYVLFAALSGSVRTAMIESMIMLPFLVAAGAGFRINLWLVVAAFVAHGVMDTFHGHLVMNTGMPAWWPAFCLSYDAAAALVLGYLLIKQNSSSSHQLSDKPMLTSRTIGATVLAATLAGSAGAQDSVPTDFQLRSTVSFTAVQMRPQGSLAKNVGLGYGLNGGYLYRLDQAGVLSIRADVGVASYGNESKRTALSETVGGRVQVNVRTTNYIMPMSVGPQLTWPAGRVRPYVSAGIGGQAFFTESSVEGVDTQSSIAHTTNQSDFTMSWVAGGGIYLPLLDGKTKVLLDVGAQYLNGGSARYLAPGSIIDLPGGQVRISPLESSTHLVVIRIGARIGL